MKQKNKESSDVMKIAAYCRVSTEKEAQIDSLEKQIEFFNEFTKKNGYELYKLYADEGISGKQIKHRKQFQQMMIDAKAKKFDKVVVKDVSRFARNTVDLLQSVRELKSYGVQVDFLNNGEVMEGGSEFILTILGAMAQQESANMSKRVKFGKDITAKKGRVPNLVFGYDKIPDERYTLKINEEEAKIVKEIFESYVYKGIGTTKIAWNLNDRGIRTKKTKSKWVQTSIVRMLKNPIYTGRVTNKKSEVTDFITGTRKELPEEELRNGEEKVEEKYSLIESIKMLVHNKYYIVILVVDILRQTYSAIINCGIYYMTYVLGKAELLGTFSGAINLALIVGLAFLPMLVAKYKGYYKLNFSGYLIAAAGRGIVIIAGYMGNVPLMLAGTVIGAIGMAPWQGNLNALVAECSEHTFLQYGKRIDGTMYSCTSMGLKVGSGLGTAIVGWLLNFGGFNGQLKVQSQSCINMLHFMYLWLPMIINILVALLLTQLNVEKANEKLRIQKEIGITK